MSSVSKNKINFNDLKHIVSQRKEVDDLICKLARTTPSLDDNNTEYRIKLLQRRRDAIQLQLEEMCSHNFGDPYYGYIQCEVCGKLKETRHA